MKPRACVVLTILLAALMFAGPAAARGVPQPAYELLIAGIPSSLHSCATDFGYKLQFNLGVWHEVEPNYAEPTFDFDASAEGQVIWFEGLDPGNMEVVEVVKTRLTNGKPNLMFVSINNYYTGQGGGTPSVYEKEFFGDELRPKQVDLRPYPLNRIGVWFHNIDFYDLPMGTCQNVDFTVLFTRIATKAACQLGGWKFYERMDGTSFASEKECIRYVVTGR